MGDTYGRSFFGTITSRLSRLLQLEGRVPIELAATVQPVVLVGDGTLPGMNDRSGKRFVFRLNLANVTWCLRANPGEQGVIVDTVHFRTLDITTVDLAYIASNQTTGYGYSSSGIVLDSQSGLEVPPVQLGSGAPFGGRNVFASYNLIPAATVFPVLPIGCYLSPGAQFAITSSNAGPLEGYVSGRIF